LRRPGRGEPLLRARVRRACRPSGFCVEGVELELWPGEALVVAGRSGSGKTTLLRGLLGLPGVTLEGSVEVNAPAGYLPQEPWRAILGPTPRYDLELSGAPLNGFEEVLDKPVHWLSAGWKQRLALRSALHGASIAVLDEPGVYLDADARRELRLLVEEMLREGGAALIVDHDPHAWRGTASKAVVLEEGRPLCSGSYEECIAHYPQPPPPPRPRGRGMGSVLVSARGVWHRYPGSTWVLRGVCMEVYAGEVAAVTGPNGSGKTTLLKILAGVYRPTRGRVVAAAPATYIPENPLLYYTGATVYEEATWGGVDEAYAEEVLRRLGLWRLRDRPLAWLSTGERRRAAIASAITHGYRVVAVDEPTAGLDPWASNQVLSLLEEAASSGAAIIMATHDERAASTATTRYRLEGGVVARLP